MKIRNLMEELVSAAIDDLCRDDAAAVAPRYCTSDECRVDAICYVLNRIAPRYVSSERGYVHLVDELERDQQLSVDILRLASEGMQRVTAVRRSYYDDHGGAPHPAGDRAVFSFPTIKGRVLSGRTFDPVDNARITLLEGEEPVAMFDSRWSNPYVLNSHAPGTYVFWPAPREAPGADSSRTFNYQLVVSAPGSEDVSHYLAIDLHSQSAETTTVSLDRDVHVPDLYIFPA